MKNQYFGDIRDLFKYDLIFELLFRSDLNHFTFIPMLTENELNTHGGKINYTMAKAGTKRELLLRFLEKCVKGNRRDIIELEKLFGSRSFPKKLELEIYEKNSYFSNKTRNVYFSAINLRLLTKSVILVDPDTGLEVKSMKGKENKYVRYDEVKLLYDRMDTCSILLIFQFIPRVKREKYISEISNSLKKNVAGESPIYFISDNQIVFFVLHKGWKIRKSLEDIIYTYARFYGLKVGIK